MPVWPFGQNFSYTSEQVRSHSRWWRHAKPLSCGVAICRGWDREFGFSLIRVTECVYRHPFSTLQEQVTFCGPRRPARRCPALLAAHRLLWEPSRYPQRKSATRRCQTTKRTCIPRREHLGRERALESQTVRRSPVAQLCFMPLFILRTNANFAILSPEFLIFNWWEFLQRKKGSSKWLEVHVAPKRL